MIATGKGKNFVEQMENVQFGEKLLQRYLPHTPPHWGKQKPAFF
uniref:Uncharacterized protein n=1 Tax=Fagus sylvatica TaxID=28930 RepID=A0A2N9IHI4_FAGSY